MGDDSSLFESWLRPRLEYQTSRIHSTLSDRQQDQLNSWVEILTETDDSLKRRSKQRRSVRSRARSFAKRVYSIAVELFVLCSLSGTISDLPTISDGAFYDQLLRWWRTQIPTKPLHGIADIISHDVPSDMNASHVSHTNSVPSEREFTFLPEAQTFRGVSSLHEPRQYGPVDVLSTGNDKARALNILSLIRSDQASDSERISCLTKDKDPTCARKRGSDDTARGESDKVEIPSKRPRKDRQPLSGYLQSPAKNQYLSFSFMRRHMIDRLPEPFRTGMEKSRQWKDEQERGGLSVTNCLSLHLPEKVNEDSFLVIRMGYWDGFKVSDLLGIGDLGYPAPGSDANDC